MFLWGGKVAALHDPSCQGSTVAPVDLILLWWGRLIKLANLVDPVVHRIFSSLSTFVVYLARGTPPSLQVLTLSLIHCMATVP